MTELSTLTDFLARLDNAGIHYSLSNIRQGAVMVNVAVPGERWEIEFMADGDVEVELFKSDGQILDRSILDELLRRHDDS